MAGWVSFHNSGLKRPVREVDRLHIAGEHLLPFALRHHVMTHAGIILSLAFVKTFVYLTVTLSYKN